MKPRKARKAMKFWVCLWCFQGHSYNPSSGCVVCESKRMIETRQVLPRAKKGKKV
jgi:hypothetical protein